MGKRRRRRRAGHGLVAAACAALAATVAVTMAASALVTATPAQAAGDPGLDSHILADPVVGWENQPHADLQRFVTYLNALEARTVTPAGGSAQTAAQGWRNPSNHGNYLVIVLVALSYPGREAGQTATAAGRAAETALASLCVGVPSRADVQTTKVAGVPGGHEITCTPNAGTSPDALGWSRGNVVGLLVTVKGLFTSTSLANVARQQYRAIPPEGVAPAGSGGGSGVPTWLIALVALLVTAGGAYWVLVISPRRHRRHRHRPPHLGPAGADAAGAEAAAVAVAVDEAG